MTDTYQIDNVSFGDLPQDAVNDILKDGRLASHFLERQLCIWYPKLTFVDGKGYDHVCTEGLLYDQKCFTKGGLGFAPSSMVGAGRKIDEEVASDHCKDIIYICCDIVDFPTVRVKFVKGSELMKSYPKFKIPSKDREQFFQENA